jgi:hypothetical protein
VLALLIDPASMLPLLQRDGGCWLIERGPTTYRDVGLVCPRGWDF